MIGTADAQLTEHGVKQAKAAGVSARQEGLTFDVIISSPLVRTLDTAKLFSSEIGYPEAKIELSDALKERFFGDIEGLHEDAFEMSKDAYLQSPRAIDHIKNVETIQELHQRAEKVLADLKKRPEDTIILVSHAAFGRSLKKVIKNIPFDKPVGNLENAQIIKLL
jgi:broad specificity phosphatase PhoE